MKIFKQKKSVKALEQELAAVRSKHEAVVSEMQTRNFRGRQELIEVLGKTEAVCREAQRSAAQLANQNRALLETIATTAASMDIERLELLARSERLGMRIKGLGFNPVLPQGGQAQ